MAILKSMCFKIREAIEAEKVNHVCIYYKEGVELPWFELIAACKYCLQRSYGVRCWHSQGGLTAMDVAVSLVSTGHICLRAVRLK